MHNRVSNFYQIREEPLKFVLINQKRCFLPNFFVGKQVNVVTKVQIVYRGNRWIGTPKFDNPMRVLEIVISQSISH